MTLSILPEKAIRASFEVTPDLAGQRLDTALQQVMGLVPRESRELAQEGRIRVEGRAELNGMPRLVMGCRVEVLSPTAQPAFLPEQIPLTILYEDEHLFLVDKPGGMAMYPGPGRPAGTLANALRGLDRSLSTLEGPLRPGIVHRLDAGTSGVMVIAKDNDIHRRLQGFFSTHNLTRQYWALVSGQPAWETYVMDAPLARRRKGRKAFDLRPDGRSAYTSFKVWERFSWAPPLRSSASLTVSEELSFTLVQALPETGRTHQIRVHLAALGHPICGDTLYGGGDRAVRVAKHLGLRRTALHAARLAVLDLGFDVTAPWPSDFAEALAQLGYSSMGGAEKIA